MIGIKNAVSCIMVAFLVMGCANATDYGDYAQSIQTSNQSGQSAMVAYFNKKSVDNQNVFKALSGGNNPQQVQNNQMAIVLYTILSQQNDQEILKQFTPKYAAKPTTNGDIGMAAMNNFLPTLVKWGAGAWLGSKVVDGLSEASTVLSGGSTMITQSAGGDINSGVSDTSSQFNQNQVGDGNTDVIQQSSETLDEEVVEESEWTDTPGCSTKSRAAGEC